MPVRGRLAALVAVLLLAGGWTPSAFAQLTTGTISGSVRDNQGAAIPGALVALVSETKGSRKEFTTDGQGNYTFPNLTPDTYTIEVVLSGSRLRSAQASPSALAIVSSCRPSPSRSASSRKWSRSRRKRRSCRPVPASDRSPSPPTRCRTCPFRALVHAARVAGAGRHRHDAASAIDRRPAAATPTCRWTACRRWTPGAIARSST